MLDTARLGAKHKANFRGGRVGAVQRTSMWVGRGCRGGQSWSKLLVSIVPLSSVKTWKAAVISKSGYSVSTTRTAKLVHAIILLRQRWTISGPVPDAHPMRCSSPLALNQIHSCLIVASASAVKIAYRCAYRIIYSI